MTNIEADTSTSAAIKQKVDTVEDHVRSSLPRAEIIWERTGDKVRLGLQAYNGDHHLWLSPEAGLTASVPVFIATPAHMLAAILLRQSGVRMREDEVASAIQQSLASLQRTTTEMNPSTSSDAPMALVEDVKRLQEQFTELRSLRTQAEHNELTAPISFPRREDMTVQLIDSSLLDRLEEYRSDETVAFLFVGAWLGAILGVLVNWYTAAEFVVTRESQVLLAILFILLGGSAFVAFRLRRRAAMVKRRLFPNDQIDQE